MGVSPNSKFFWYSLLCLLGFALSPDLQAQDACDAKSICSLATRMAKEHNGVIKIPERQKDGMHNRSVLGFGLKPEKCTMDFCMYKDQRRMRILFNESKSRLKKIYLKGRKLESLSSEEKNVYARFDAAQFVLPADGSCHKYCMDGGSAANAQIHSSLGPCVCPFLENLPDEALVQLYAHELSHYGDSCNSMDSIGSTDKHPRIPAIPFHQHPFNQPNGLTKCLMDNQIVTGWHAPEGAEQQLDKFVSHKLKNSPGSTFVAWAKPLITAYVKSSTNQFSNKECMGLLGGSQLTEAQCDHIGWEVAADFLKDNPLDPKDPYSKLRVFATFLFNCGNKGGLQVAGPHEYSAHPANADRIDKIAMNVQSLRDAINCGPVKGRACDRIQAKEPQIGDAWSSEITPPPPAGR